VNNERQLFKVVESQNPITQATANYLTTHHRDRSLPKLNFKIDEQPYFLQVLPYQDNKGLDWRIVVVVPKSDFMAQITNNNRTTILLCLAALVIAIAIDILTARWVTQPILRLNAAAQNIAQGKWDRSIPISTVGELEKLAKAFNRHLQKLDIDSSMARVSNSFLEMSNRMAEQLRESFTDLEAKNRDLQSLDRLKDEFLANTSHELRTPIYGMVGIAESMLDGETEPISDWQKRNLSIIVQSGYRLTNLINDILDFSKLRHRDIQLQLKPVDVRAIAEIVLTVSQMLAANKNLQLINAIPNDLPLAEADENRLQQILYNLVGYLTVSLGVSMVIPSPTSSSDSLINAVDRALYEVKKQGRDRICFRKN
jgi:two-component system, sensor histidine kinase ChiS